MESIYKITVFQAPPKYEFKYIVTDPKTGDQKEQEETRVGDVVKGQYSLAEPDGTIRVVKYTADKVNGFNAIVERVGKAGHPVVVQKAAYAVPVVQKAIALPVVQKSIAVPVVSQIGITSGVGGGLGIGGTGIGLSGGYGSSASYGGATSYSLGGVSSIGGYGLSGGLWGNGNAKE